MLPDPSDPQSAAEPGTVKNGSVKNGSDDSGLQTRPGGGARVDQGAINQIILDATPVDPGSKMESVEKELSLVKGSIKKLIIDIREQMNNCDNPFSNLESIEKQARAVEAAAQAAREAAAAEQELLKKNEVKPEKPAEAKVEEPKAEIKEEKKSEKKAEKDDTMAQLKDAGSHSCPLMARLRGAPERCPAAAREAAAIQGCPLAGSHGSASSVYNHPSNHLYPGAGSAQDPYHSCEYARRDPACGGSGPHPSQGYQGAGHVCSACGKPVEPGYESCSGSRPAYYPPYQGGWYERPPCDVHRGVSGQPAFERYPAHPAYRSAYHDHGYYPPYDDARGDYPPYPPQEPAPYRQPRLPPGYYYPRESEDWNYPEQRSESYPPRQAYGHSDPDYYRPGPMRRGRGRPSPAEELYEGEGAYEAPEATRPAPGYNRPGARPRRSLRGPEELPDSYADRFDDEPAVPMPYRPVQGRRKVPSIPTESEPEEEYELTEPVADIDELPDHPEPEPAHSRKKSRRIISMVELPQPELSELPNPKPRRTRSANRRS